jgi:hypothetical protein
MATLRGLGSRSIICIANGSYGLLDIGPSVAAHRLKIG